MIPIAQPSISDLEIQYVNEALKSGWISNHGSFVKDFERSIANRHGSGVFGVSCSSGTAALHLALLASGLPKGSQVLVPNLTFAATLNVVLHCGLEPVLVDVDDEFCMDPKWALHALRQHRHVKAIAIVWLYGNSPSPLLWEIAKDHKLVVIEDRAECVSWQPLLGHFACYSFYANKHITTGEGGMVVTRHAEATRLFRDHGMIRPYYHLIPGLNYRMTNVAAAIGCAQLERYEGFYEQRMKNISIYDNQTIGTGKWLWVLPKREMTICETRPVFDPLHTLPYMNRGDFYPNSIRLHRDMMCLPTGPHLDDQDVIEICREYEAAECQ